MDLPSSFEEYLESLSTKQRHEVRRKMRRLTEEGKIEYRFIEKGGELTAAMDTFFKMFVESRQDKAAFLTEQMKSYFRLLVDTMAGYRFIKAGRAGAGWQAGSGNHVLRLSTTAFICITAATTRNTSP